MSAYDERCAGCMYNGATPIHLFCKHPQAFDHHLEIWVYSTPSGWCNNRRSGYDRRSSVV